MIGGCFFVEKDRYEKGRVILKKVNNIYGSFKKNEKKKNSFHQFVQVFIPKTIHMWYSI